MKESASDLADLVTCKPEFLAKLSTLTTEEKLRLVDSFQIVGERIRKGISQKKTRVKKVQKQITLNIWELQARGCSMSPIAQRIAADAEWLRDVGDLTGPESLRAAEITEELAAHMRAEAVRKMAPPKPKRKPKKKPGPDFWKGFKRNRITPPRLTRRQLPGWRFFASARCAKIVEAKWRFPFGSNFLCYLYGFL